jgi:hypothetical protein
MFTHYSNAYSNLDKQWRKKANGYKQIELEKDGKG